MRWNRVAKSLQAFSAHISLFCFTLLLLVKLDHLVSYSWWVIFLPLFLFHSVVARGRFSLPAPSVPHGRNWAPFHAIVATPLLVAFELLLCVFLRPGNINPYPYIWLRKFPLMCKALLPVEDESLSDDAIWETLPHFWVAISMVFFVAATVFTLLKLSGDVSSLGWWDLFINFGIAECFAFLVCTKWSNPVIHRSSQTLIASSSATAIRYLDPNSPLVGSTDDISENTICGVQDIGGHVMKIPIIGFQLLLFMRLEGKPTAARFIPLPIVFSPLFLVQGLGVLFATSKLVESIIILQRTGAGTGRYFRYAARARDSFSFLNRGSRLLGWWSTDEGSQEEQARIYYNGSSGYNTFSGYPPEVVKRMPKKDLTEEVWRLQAALNEQTEITKSSQQNYERLQNEKILCRICFEREISIVLLPCRHHILCSTCSEKCKKCPICRVIIEERLSVYDI